MSTKENVTAREAQRIATRERLFEAAVAEFKGTGVGDADVGAIVGEAGVAHGTFFFHFPTKEHVLAELGHREEIRLARELEKFLAEPRDLEATLLEVLRLTASLERRLGSVLFDDLLALYFSPTRAELRLWPDHPLILAVMREFELARDRGEVHDDPDLDPVNAAGFWFMGLFGLLISYERSATRTTLLEQSVTLVLRGLEPR